ncbi:MAG: helicase HerA-like domain-containing protein, partial [Pseudomonadota bacterium]
IAENAKALTLEYGNVSRASVGAIQRRLLTLEQEGAKAFFGEPALDLNDFIMCDEDGRGIVNILAADKLMASPKLYATFLLWLLSELFEELPEVGDPDKPKLVFFFDEAHLLFRDAPKALLEKIEQVVRLIRSKGVGVYFVTQNPADVPDAVASQLGNRIQHALRAFTPKQQRDVRAAAETFRPNKKFKAEEAITELGVGEALVSTLMKKGVPSVVERTLIRPPSSRMGPVTAAERKEVLLYSDFTDKYDKKVDRKSAYEILAEQAERKAAEADRKAEEKAKEKQRAAKRKSRNKTSRTRTSGRRRSSRQSSGEAFIKSAMRSAGTQIGRALMRGILGGLKR